MCAKASMEEFEALLKESFEIDTPEECVGAFLFLASAALSPYIIGQVIEVNGGQLMP